MRILLLTETSGNGSMTVFAHGVSPFPSFAAVSSLFVLMPQGFNKNLDWR